MRSRRMLLAMLAGMACLAAGCRHKTAAVPANTAEPAAVEAPRQSGAGVAVMNAALQASDADVGMLKDLAGRLDKACARNKYGLSEQECLDRLHTRQDDCATQTAARYPGRLEDTGRMQVVMKAYMGCIFEN